MTLPEIKLMLYRTLYLAASSVIAVISTFYVFAYAGIWCGEVSRLFTHKLNPYQRADYVIDAHDWGEDICAFAYLAGFSGACWYVGRKLGLFGHTPEQLHPTPETNLIGDADKNYTPQYPLHVKNDKTPDPSALARIAVTSASVKKLD